MKLYYPSNSLLHYMHGFTKILTFGLILSIMPFLMDKVSSLLVMLFISLSLIAYIRPPRQQRLLLIPVIIIAISMSLSYFFADMGGEVYARVDLGYWIFQISSGNLNYAVLLFLRTIIWCLLFFIILFTTNDEDVVIGLKKFGLPEFVTLSAALTLRYWSMMIFDVKTVMDAQYVRGADFRSGSLWTRTKRFASVLIPVLFVFLKRFRTTSYALTLKGVGRKNKRTYYYNPQLTVLDRRMIGGAVIVLAIWLAVRSIYDL
ncbi:energy-coupling factor transporter transmembrane component T family protein [Paenibacillus pinihumi]|uniref:energy-coupling factor transporter transmembrane component T family protein n=1 Tax=Paenibacillus pinihumi TaxID=669462 RepID=UPI0004114E26|nr:energy-coupling factor transporter transmembrane component T [Paenibacillus pinihumi]